MKHFTSSHVVQVNKNYASALHVDKNNRGPSLIVALGDFEGGELWTYDQGPLVVKNKVVDWSSSFIPFELKK